MSARSLRLRYAAPLLMTAIMPPSPLYAKNFPPNASEADFSVISFAQILGRAKADVPICHLDKPLIGSALKNALIILRARYRQVGRTTSDAEHDMNDAYRTELAADRRLPVMCPSTIDEYALINSRSAQQAVEYLNRNGGK